MIIEKIYIDNVTSKELVEEETKNFSELINILEKNNPDSTFFVDANLSALLDCLYYAGYNDDNILKLNNNLYGNFISFYYLTDDDIYIMEVGIR